MGRFPKILGKISQTKTGLLMYTWRMSKSVALTLKHVFKIELLIIYVAIINFGFSIYFKTYSNRKISELDSQMLKIQLEENSGNFNHDDLIEKLTYDYAPFTYFDQELKTELSEIIELLETNQNTIEPIITFQNNMHQTQIRLNLGYDTLLYCSLILIMIAVFLIVEKSFKNRIDLHRLKVMSEEQSKISRNLHDGVAQDLAALKLYLEKEDISKSKFYAQQAFNEVRYMIGTTHLNLNESFEEIVKKLAATLEANYNISTKVYIGSTKIQHLSENVQIELIRILQEALSNISRHANASNVEIRFVDGIDDFRFIIKDDGKGFSEEEVELKNKQSAKKHYGVSNIKERVELLGGTVNFISEGGTTIAITIKDSVR